jgi:hypothetical protein
MRSCVVCSTELPAIAGRGHPRVYCERHKPARTKASRRQRQALSDQVVLDQLLAELPRRGLQSHVVMGLDGVLELRIRAVPPNA